MSERFVTMITDLGVTKINQAIQTESKINLTHIAVGDGNGSFYTPLPNMSALKNEKWKGSITEIETTETRIIVRGIIPSSEGGFFIREIGVFDEMGDLIAIGNLPETEKNSSSEGAIQEMILVMELIISNQEAFEIAVDPTVVIATKSDLEEHTKNQNIHVPPNFWEEYQNALRMLLDKFERLEHSLFSNITGNPFSVEFSDLDGVVIESGIWNKEKQRIEC